MACKTPRVYVPRYRYHDASRAMPHEFQCKQISPTVTICLHLTQIEPIFIMSIVNETILVINLLAQNYVLAI